MKHFLGCKNFAKRLLIRPTTKRFSIFQNVTSRFCKQFSLPPTERCYMWQWTVPKDLILTQCGQCSSFEISSLWWNYTTMQSKDLIAYRAKHLQKFMHAEIEKKILWIRSLRAIHLANDKYFLWNFSYCKYFSRTRLKCSANVFFSYLHIIITINRVVLWSSLKIQQSNCTFSSIGLLYGTESLP